MTRVLVVGSINMDLVTRVGAMPRLGETLLGERFDQYPGGKGANQAVAAARLGAQVSMIGCVGNDNLGASLLAHLDDEGVDTRWIRAVPVPTGIAAITVVGSDNAIVVAPGANHALLESDLDRVAQAFAHTDIVLAQLEVPVPVILHAARLARRHGKPLLLNPAPAVPLPRELLDLTAALTPNQHEMGLTLGAPQADWHELLQQRMPGRIVMTHGSAGAYYMHGGDAARVLCHEPGFTVRAVDSTGAGDTFNGALATFWHLGLPAAVRLANAAGALSVTRPGAQGGMPTLNELEQFMREFV